MIREWKKIKPLNRKLKPCIKPPCFADVEKKFRTKLEATWHIKGESPGKVVAIGINPSKAGQKKSQSDNSVTRLTHFLDMYGFDNFTIINLFENVSSDGSVDYDSKTNFEKHRELFESADVILVVWGIETKNHAEQKIAACKVLRDFNEKLYCIQSGNGKFPRHMRVIEHDWEIIKCSVNEICP